MLRLKVASEDKLTDGGKQIFMTVLAKNLLRVL